MLPKGKKRTVPKLPQWQKKNRPQFAHCQERKKKISLAKSKHVICFSTKGELIKEFKTIKDAALFANVSVFAIYHNIDGQSKSSGGYKWKFKY